MIKAIIFDMDGTVIDSTEADYQAMKKMFEEYQINFSYTEYIDVLGAKGSEIIKSHLKIGEQQIEEMLKRKENYFKAYVGTHGLKAIADIETLLLTIKDLGLKTALATGAGAEKLNFIFDRIHLRNYFDKIFTADDTRYGKPDPEIFLNSAKRLNVKPSEAIVMEDATYGVKAAKEGGFKCIAITSTRGKDKLQSADLIIDSYNELDIADFLKKINEC